VHIVSGSGQRLGGAFKREQVGKNSSSKRKVKVIGKNGKRAFNSASQATLHWNRQRKFVEWRSLMTIL
jgi:hypothetical protein